MICAHAHAAYGNLCLVEVESGVWVSTSEGRSWIRVHTIMDLQAVKASMSVVLPWYKGLPAKVHRKIAKYKWMFNDPLSHVIEPMLDEKSITIP